jgi:hypothetical protein
MTDWQAIETAPKDGTKVDIWVIRIHSLGGEGSGRVPNAYWETKYEGWWVKDAHDGDMPVESTDPYIHEVTHWMPVPAPPRR